MKLSHTFIDTSIVGSDIPSTISFDEDYLNNPEFQEILNKYLYDLPLFSKIVDKGMSKTKRKCRLYYRESEFIGYIIYVDNFMSFKEDRQFLGFDKGGFFETININDIEIRESIRKNKSNPRYGNILMNTFISEMQNEWYDGITLQGNSEWHISYYEKTYGFLDLKDGGNAMILWF